MAYKTQKAHSRFTMATIKTQYWKNSKDKDWERVALESYERISKRGKMQTKNN